jgi:hypothetical protein
MRDSAVPAAAWCPVPEIEPGCRTRTSQLSHRISLFGRTRATWESFLAVECCSHKKRGKSGSSVDPNIIPAGSVVLERDFRKTNKKSRLSQ